MARNKPSTNRPSRPYGRTSTKRRAALRLPAHPGRILLAVLSAVVIIVLAVLWGNHLKRESDKLRADREAGRWTLDATVAEPIPVRVPDMRALEIRPEGNVGDIVMAGSHGGVILPLDDGAGGLCYASAVGADAGLTIPEEAPPLVGDVTRVQGRGLRVVCALRLTFPSESDTSVSVYRRGLELALLCEAAEAGADELLLLGLPAGSETADRLTVDFLNELHTHLTALPHTPAVGVALLPERFVGTETEAYTDAAGVAHTGSLYAGNASPLRVLNACDYLAMDLRDLPAEELELLLPRLEYAYVRHSLRMLVNQEASEAASVLEAHGFDRIYEMSKAEPAAEAG